MTEHDTGEAGLPTLNIREKRWLHAHLLANPDSFFPGSLRKVKNTETIVEDLASQWDASYMSTQVKAWKKAYFLPEIDLAWISHSHQRQLVWLLNELSLVIPTIPITGSAPAFLHAGRTPFIPAPSAIRPEHRYGFAIATIDAWPLSVSEKLAAVRDIRQNWEQSQLNWKQVKWLDGKSRQQMDWAVDYINKSEFRRRYGVTYSCLYTDDIKEKHVYVLGFLDHLYRLGADSRELFITKMRKTWSQKKYRESDKAKKQVYFSLSDEARRHLDQLEKARKMTKNRIIEDLLAEAAGAR
ncbi:MAG TPA: hypothetical protein EYG00_13760 [Alcanivorax sp.]|jgi:hypothetical protein|uniref:hypothetical protein n=1 Tax=Marinimicrobium sp. UBA4509 TaxID=1946811 RepID=UPI001A1250F0|nr:hypothetical protein [Marinimicrobium sp. UBA4509]HIK75747.1 hypothetical protein [Alcanivorax sp.]